jgi:hypothetical protein
MPRIQTLLLSVFAVGLFAADAPGWKSKPIPEWTADDAQQVLSDSPWAKSVTPAMTRTATSPDSGRRGGIGLGGVGIGLPGGMGRRGGGGYPGRTGGGETLQPPTLKLRWESALPVREAELKARDIAAPTVDPDYYAIAVYGIPERMVNADDKTLPEQLKKEASLKRSGKMDVKPSSVDILQREDGPVVV